MQGLKSKYLQECFSANTYGWMIDGKILTYAHLISLYIMLGCSLTLRQIGYNNHSDWGYCLYTPLCFHLFQ